MTDPKELARGYRDKAARCRRLARQTHRSPDRQEARGADREFDEQAAEIEKSTERNSP
jgi:hypothetical protein